MSLVNYTVIIDGTQQMVWQALKSIAQTQGVITVQKENCLLVIQFGVIHFVYYLETDKAKQLVKLRYVVTDAPNTSTILEKAANIPAVLDILTDESDTTETLWVSTNILDILFG